MAHLSQETADPLRGGAHATVKGKGPAASPQGWPDSFFGGERLSSLS